MSHFSLVEVAAQSCGQNVICTYHGGNMREKAFGFWLAQGYPEAVDGYQDDFRSASKKFR